MSDINLKILNFLLIFINLIILIKYYKKRKSYTYLKF